MMSCLARADTRLQSARRAMGLATSGAFFPPEALTVIGLVFLMGGAHCSSVLPGAVTSQG